MEKISVIIPVHNPPLARFRLCLKSIASQIYENYEVILVDDGSTNNYENVLNDYRGKIPGLQVIKQECGGVSKARNNGIAHATGEYIAFCDSDDYVEDNYLYSMAKAMDSVDLVICGVTEQSFPTIDSKVNGSIFSAFPSKYIWLQYVNFSVNKLYRADFFRDYGLQFDESVFLGEDALFLNSYLKHCSRICTISSNLYHYLPNPDSAIHNYKPDYWQWEKRVIEAQLDFFTRIPLNDNEIQFMQRWLYIKFKGAINYYIDNENNPIALHRYLKEIEKNSYFEKLYSIWDYKLNPCLNAKDRVFLKFWKNLGVKGMLLGRGVTKRLKR